jgi:phosphoribosylformylglycinamidine cyclo-ligase
MAVARTYREAGVDVDAAARAVDRIGQVASRTFSRNVLAPIGGFASAFRFAAGRYANPVLVASTDSVGSKVKVAIGLGKHDTVGADVVNHCVNDIAVTGAEPLFFLDYLAVGRLDEEVVAQVVGGVADACAALRMPLVGGETAELPDLYAPEDYDLAGFVVGVAERAALIDGSAVRKGDWLIGLPSSGLHTNGYTLARRVFPPADWERTAPGIEGTIGQALLAPHRCYLDDIRRLRTALRRRHGDVVAFAHLTGGGWVGNIPRTLPDRLGVEVKVGSWRVPAIFSLLQERGDIADQEMVRTFNLGIGLTAVIPAALGEVALRALPDAVELGRVVRMARDESRVRFV